LPGNIFDRLIRDGNDLGYTSFGHCNLQLHCSGRRRFTRSSAAVLFGIPIIAQPSGVS
jgi:hypothetical protein